MAAFTQPSYELNFVHHPVEDLGVPDSSEGLHALIDGLIERVGRGVCESGCAPVCSLNFI